MRALLHLQISVIVGDESSQDRGSACLKMWMQASLHVEFPCVVVTNRLMAEVVRV